MERLSDRAIEILDDLGTDRLGYHSEYLPLIEAAHKLAEYEATGLEPSEIQCAKENLHILDLFKEQAQDAEECIRIAEARRDGRLMVLPCKVGDMVYYRRGQDILGDNVARIIIDGIDNQVLVGAHKAFMFCDFGRNVFLTREEAEDALKQQQEAEAEK